MGVNQKLLRGAFGGVTFTAVSMGISFLQLRVLLHYVSLEMAGIWLIFANIGSYAMSLDIGLTPTLGREISFAAGNPSFTAEQRDERIGTLVRSCTTIVAALSTLVLLLGGPIGWFYLRSIAPHSMWSGTRGAWGVYIFATALNLLGQGWFAGIYGLGQVFSEKMIRSVSAIFGFVLLLIALHTGTGLTGLAIAFLLQSLCGVVIARIVLSRLTSSAISRGHFDFQVVRAMVGPSLKYAATLLGTIMILQTDNIVIATTLGPQLIPDYQAVAKIVTALMTLAMMLVLTSMPLMSQAYARNDIAEIVQVLNRNLRFSLSVMVILGSFVACFADRVIAVWLGAGHFVGFPIVWVLLIMTMLEAHHQAMSGATMSTGRLVFVTPALLSGLLNIVVSVVLAKHYGVLGVVLGTLISQIAINDWYVPRYTMKLFGFGLKSHVRNTVAPILGLLVFMLGIGTGLRILTRHLSNLLSVEIGAVCTLAVGILCFSFLVITRSERGTLLQKLRQLGVRWTAAPPADVLQ